MRLLPTALIVVTVTAIGAGVALWFASAPRGLEAQAAAALPDGDASRGEAVFWAGGCASCHAAPGATGQDRLILAGGVQLQSEFGTFVAPNISSHDIDGIGAWTLHDFANAMLRGVSPDGTHYYPAFPYASYARMSDGDVADLFAFMQALPAVEGTAGPNIVSFPFNIRRGIGLWKRLHVEDAPIVALDGAAEDVLRGQYLVEGLGHCGECHTPRDWTGGLDTSRWLAGGPAPEGRGSVPNITVGEGGIEGWSAQEIADLLETGFTPDFDSVGGSMASVVRNYAQLPQEDRDAVAAYLLAIPPVASE